MQMEFIRRMPQPQELMRDYPVSPELKQRKADRDREIREILEGKDDRFLVVLGSADHPEVVGFLSRFDGQKFVFENAEAAEAAIRDGVVPTDGSMTPVLVAQTTQNLGEWEKTKKLSKRVFAI